MVRPFKKASAPKPRTWRKRTVATKRKPRPTITKKNATAIVRLQKQVNSAQQGYYQTNFQLANLVIPNNYALRRSHPICFCMNDMTSRTQQNNNGGRIYGCSYTGVSPDIINTPFVVGQWGSVNPSFSFGMAQKFRQHSDDNLNTASLVAYAPISATYNMTFSRATQQGQAQDTYIRVDMVESKRRYLNSTQHAYAFPENLGSFQELAISNAEGMRNKYNPALWKVTTKYLKIKAVPPADPLLPRKDNGATLRLYKAFDRKTIRLNLDATGANTYEDFYLATDPKSQTWCVISTSDDVTPADGSPLNVYLQRTIRYRDQHGISM